MLLNGRPVVGVWFGRRARARIEVDDTRRGSGRIRAQRFETSNIIHTHTHTQRAGASRAGARSLWRPRKSTAHPHPLPKPSSISQRPRILFHPELQGSLLGLVLRAPQGVSLVRLFTHGRLLPLSPPQIIMVIQDFIPHSLLLLALAFQRGGRLRRTSSRFGRQVDEIVGCRDEGTRLLGAGVDVAGPATKFCIGRLIHRPLPPSSSSATPDAASA